MRLLKADGWIQGHRTTHGVAFTKIDKQGQCRTTIVPDKGRPLVPSTLHLILGLKQTCIGRQGLLELIERFGL